MTATIHPPVQSPAESINVDVPMWSWAVLGLAMLGSFLMLQENGWLLTQWETLHEFFHDGRHSLGFPCH